MSPFSRTMTIRNGMFDNSATLIFCFDHQLLGGIYRDYYPTVFRALEFPAGESGSATITYRDQLVFTVPEILDGGILGTTVRGNIDREQQTSLELGGNRVYEFATPSGGTSGSIKAINRTGQRVDIGVGFEDSQAGPSTVLVWPHVDHENNVTIDFTPKLSAYVIADYKQGQIILGAIQAPIIWQRNLVQLEENSQWVFEQDVDTGEYRLVPE